MDELDEFVKQDSITNFGQLRTEINMLLQSNVGLFIMVVPEVDENNGEHLLIQSKEMLCNTAVPKFSLKIWMNLAYEAFHCGVKCTIKTLSNNRIMNLNKWSSIEEAIRYLNCTSMTHKEKIIHKQQISMSSRQVSEKKYSPEMLVRAFEYFAMSRSTYSRLREDFEFPSVSTLTRLTPKVNNMDDGAYLNAFFSNLWDARQRNCVILIDEVYVKLGLQYSGGTVFGKAINNPDTLANTVLGFMIIPLFGGPKLMVKMMPVAKLGAEFLYAQTTALLSLIKTSGGNVVAVLCDGNRVNQALFKKFETDTVPWRTKENLFLLFDFVHIIKNIRNNWITEKCQQLKFLDENGEVQVADWERKRKLWKIESGNIVKVSKLSRVSVNPKPIERQIVSICLEVFCEERICVLCSHPDLSEATGTIKFMSAVLEFWRIVNVHSAYADVRMRDSNRVVIRTENDRNLEKLTEFGKMAMKMYQSNKGLGKHDKTFKKDTAHAIWHTCNGLVELSKHLLSLPEFDFVMLGNFTSDPIEKYFGKLRQRTGGAYFITERQVIEKFRINKAKIMVRLNVEEIEAASQCEHSCNKCTFSLNQDLCGYFDNLPQLEEDLPIDVKMTLVYISGDVVRKK